MAYPYNWYNNFNYLITEGEKAMKEILMKLAEIAMPLFIVNVTPKIREAMVEWVQNRFWPMAKTTPNKWDDYVCEFLAKLLAFELPE